MECVNCEPDVIYRRTSSETSTTELFFKDFEEKKLNFNLCETEVQEITSSVYEIVNRVMAKVSEHDNRFTFSEIVKLGSIAEGTKLVEPNEFDYLCILKDFSNPDMVRCRKVCSHNPGHTHIFIEDKSLLKKWENFMDEGQLLANKIFAELSRIVNDIYMNMVKEQKKIKVETSLGHLHFGGFSVKDGGPNTVFHMYWIPVNAGQKMDICVDVSPAIRYFGMEDISLSPVFATSKVFQNLTSVLLVPGLLHKTVNKCMDKCFRISCTEIEVQLMKSLSEQHISCYKILKYMISYLGLDLSVSNLMYLPLSSFILKMAVIQHAACCKVWQTKKKCMDDIADFILACFMPKDRPKPFMSNIFLKEHNLLFKLEFIQQHDITAMNFLMHVQVLTGFKEFQQKLDEEHPLHYNYDKCYELIEILIKRLEEVKGGIYKTFYAHYKAHGRWNFINGTSRELVALFEYPVSIFSQ
ncbi:unnamed protein product [Mytilus coruscus]|uniref:Mab-21-like nucleotidyltransferase domain-containing protein n=1 Tax=Mytilus coruscus TaxID=42192 RepID=A0A6J8A5X0_MYTCO|nr:unnamed protein product [Mytilus coruscus]